MKPFSSIKLMGFAVLGLAACGGDDDATFTRVQQEIFTPSCTFSACHNNQSRQGNLTLEAGASFDNLIEVEADQPGAKARGLERVVPGEPEQSFLFLKVRPPLEGDLGDVMPQGTPTGLEADRLELLRAWIEAGAPND